MVYQLKQPFREGTTQVVFSPQDFLARLAALVPRPCFNLTRYHGVFAPCSPPSPRHRAQPQRTRTPGNTRHTPSRQTLQPLATDLANADTEPPTAPLTWAQRLNRVFDIDITCCLFCGGQLRVISDITDPDLIRKILDHVQQRALPRALPRRATRHTSPTKRRDRP